MVIFNGIKLKFEWSAAKDGYFWADALYERPEEAAVRILTDGYTVGEPRATIVDINPIEMDSALHRNFAKLTPDENSIANFAKKYGALEAETLDNYEIEGKQNPSERVLVEGETLDSWRAEIERMKSVLSIWDAVQNNVYQALPAFFKDCDEYIAKDRSRGNRSELVSRNKPAAINKAIIDTELLPPRLISLLQRGDFSRPALFFVMSEIEERIKGELRFSFSPSEDGEKPELRLSPGTLLGAMWSLFAAEVSEEKTYEECEQCEKWFEVEKRNMRKSRMYCSNACKTEAYRSRQVKARLLHSEGASIQDIAEEVGSNVETVQKWVGGNDNARNK